MRLFLFHAFFVSVASASSSSSVYLYGGPNLQGNFGDRSTVNAICYANAPIQPTVSCVYHFAIVGYPGENIIGNLQTNQTSIFGTATYFNPLATPVYALSTKIKLAETWVNMFGPGHFKFLAGFVASGVYATTPTYEIWAGFDDQTGDYLSTFNNR